MNATTLLQQSIPRPQETIDACAALTAKPFRKLANAIGLGFVGMILVISTAFDLTTAIVSIFYIGVLPWIGLRWLVRRDYKCAKRLAKNAPAYRASLVGASELNPGLPVITLSWHEGGREVGGRFELIRPFAYKPNDPIVVLARRRRDRVLAMIGDSAMFVGHRLYRWHPPVS